jgi:two-component system LytT family response regulator
VETIRTLIVDDEPLAREGLQALLQKEEDIELVGQCQDGKEAVKAINKKKPDLVFLDVQMPELDGFGVLEKFDLNELPTIVFVTAYDKYALRAFEVHAVDYLLKPVDGERFRATLDRVRLQLELKKTNAVPRKLTALLEDLASKKKTLDRLVVKTGGRIFFLKTDEIDWIEAAGDYVKLHIGTAAHLVRETLTELESKLDPERFLRIHRSTIVNLDRIKEMQPMFYGDYVVILRSGTQLSMSRTYKEKLAKMLDK